MHWTRRIAKGACRAAISSLPVLLLLAALPALHFWAPREALLLDVEALAAGQFWRLISGHFVHWSDWHLAMNVAGLAIWPLLCDARWPVWRWALLLALLSLGVSAGVLLMAPDILRYAGFSGVLHGLFLLGLYPAARAGDRIAIACLLYLVGKVIIEAFTGPLFADAERLGAAVAQEAHLAGALGAAAILIVAELRRLRGARSA